jgi:hypothetical protein
MNASHTQSNEEACAHTTAVVKDSKIRQDAVAKSNSNSFSTIAVPQECSSGRDEWIYNSNSRKRARSVGDDPVCEESNGEESNGEELNEQASDDGRSDDGGSDDGRSETCIVSRA